MTMKCRAADFADVGKSVLVAVVLSLAMVLIFAAIALWSGLDEAAIVPVNIAIRIVSVAIACWMCMRSPHYGWIKGIATGLIFTLVTYLVYSAIASDFRNNPMTVYDIAASVIAGILASVTAVNFRAHKENA